MSNAALEKRLSRIDNLPSLPMVLCQLQKVMGNPRSSMSHIAWLGRHWGTPEVLSAAMAGHHDLSRLYGVNQSYESLVTVTHAANALCHVAKTGASGDSNHPLLDHLKMGNLSKELLGAIIKEARNKVEGIIRDRRSAGEQQVLGL